MGSLTTEQIKKDLYKYLKAIREELDRRGFRGDGISGRIYEFLLKRREE